MDVINGHCSFCLDQVEISNGRELDKKLYEDIFECNKELLKDDLFLLFDWDQYNEIQSPFCISCFKVSKTIYQISKKLTELQNKLQELVHNFGSEIKLRASKNSQKRSATEETRNGDKYNEVTVKEEIVFDYNCEISSPFYEHSENEVELESDAGNLYNSEDEEQYQPKCPSDAQFEPKLNSTDQTKTSPQWPLVVLERLAFDKNGKVVPSRLELKNSVTGRSIRKRKLTIQRSSTNQNKKPFRQSARQPSRLRKSYKVKSSGNNIRSSQKNLQCDICLKPSISLSNLKIHRLSHNGDGERPHKCRPCSLSFNFVKEYRQHRLDVHPNIKQEPFHCDMCNLSFNRMSVMKKHNDVVHEKLLLYLCPICDRPFGKKSGMQDHLITHMSEDEKYKCHICEEDRFFAYIHLLINHQAKYHNVLLPDSVFSCQKCGNSFCEDSELNLHCETGDMQKCTQCSEHFFSHCDFLLHFRESHPAEDLPYFCRICDVVCGSSLLLKEHVSSHTAAESNIPTIQKKKEIKCGICHKTFKKNYLLREHATTHSEDKPWMCPQCGMTFKNKTVLRNHERCRHGEAKKPTMKHKCPECPKMYGTKYLLKIHIKTHNEGFPFVCHICSKGFAHSAALKRHVNTHVTHEEVDKVYYCDVCGMAFRLLEYLQRHKKTHNEVKPYKCTQCDKSFVMANYLTHHMQTHSEAQFSCDQCGKTFNVLRYLKDHIKTQHPPEGDQFSCQLCTKTFSSSKNLKYHAQMHSGERPFKCQVRGCEKAFVTAFILKKHSKIHERLKEEHSKLLKCGTCAQEFEVPLYFHEHIATHAGDKKRPHLCRLCGKTFDRKNAYQTHLRTHTGEKPYSCDNCRRSFNSKKLWRVHEKRNTCNKVY